MRKLIATVFNYSLDGLLADEGTEFGSIASSCPKTREPDDPAQLDFLCVRTRSGGGLRNVSMASHTSMRPR